MPCGKTSQWYLWSGSCKFVLGTEKAKRGASSGCSGMLKKQSFRSIITSGQSLGIMERLGRPGWRGPMFSITALIFLRSCNNLQVSEVFLWITNTGEFQGLLVGLIWPFCSCSATRFLRALSLLVGRGHCSVQIGVSVFQVSFKVLSASVAPTKNPVQFWLPIEKANLFPTLWWVSALYRDGLVPFSLAVL